MHKFFYEQRKAFSFRKLTIGLVSLCVGTSLLFGIQSQEVSATTVSPSQIRFEYVLEAELSAEERQLIQSSLPAELKEEATYFVVYRPSKKVLPATGELAGSGLAVLGLGFLVLAVSATKSKKARVLTMLYVTTSGLALPVLEVGAVQSSALAAYNQTLTIRPGDSLPDGKLRLDGYDFVGYYVQESSVKTSLPPSETEKNDAAKGTQASSVQSEGKKSDLEELAKPSVLQENSESQLSNRDDSLQLPLKESSVEKTENTVSSETTNSQTGDGLASPNTSTIADKKEDSPNTVESQNSGLDSTLQIPGLHILNRKDRTDAVTEVAPIGQALPFVAFRKEKETFALELVKQEDPQLEIGKSRLVPGQEGEKEITYADFVQGEKILRSEKISEQVTKNAVAPIMYVGTKQVEAPVIPLPEVPSSPKVESETSDAGSTDANNSASQHTEQPKPSTSDSAVDLPVPPQPEVKPEVDVPIPPQPETTPETEEPVSPQPEVVPETEVPVSPQPEVVPETEVPVSPQPEVVPETEVAETPQPEVVPETEVPVSPQPEVAPETEVPVSPQPEVVPETEEPVAPQPEVVPETEEPVSPQPEVAPETEEPVAPQPEVAPETEVPTTPNTGSTDATSGASQHGESTENPTSQELTEAEIQCILDPSSTCWPEKEEEVEPKAQAQQIEEAATKLREKMEELQTYKSRFKGKEWTDYINTVYEASRAILEARDLADMLIQTSLIEDDLRFLLVETDANSGASQKTEGELIFELPTSTSETVTPPLTPTTPDSSGSTTPKPSDSTTAPSTETEEGFCPIDPKPEDTCGPETSPTEETPSGEGSSTSGSSGETNSSETNPSTSTIPDSSGSTTPKPSDSTTAPSTETEEEFCPIDPKPEETCGPETSPTDGTPSGEGSSSNVPSEESSSSETGSSLSTTPDSFGTTTPTSPVDSKLEEKDLEEDADIGVTPIEDISLLPKPTMNIRGVDLQKDKKIAVVRYVLDDPAERYEGAVAYLYANDKVVSSVAVKESNNQLQAVFENLDANVDYVVRTELTYMGASESLVDSLADEASIEIEERQLQIKNIDRVELWKLENNKASIQRELAEKPEKLTNYFAKVISNQQKEILLPISQVELVTENGEQFYSVTASLDNLVEEQSTSNTYRPGLTFRVAKQKPSVATNTYTDFTSLVQAIKTSPWATFTLGADLTASTMDATGKDSYITGDFMGTLNGADYTIYDLQAPLFHKTSGRIENLNLKDVTIHQKDKKEVGALAKEAKGGHIENVRVEGSVTGGNHVGALVGIATNTQITNVGIKARVSSQSTETTDNYVGGLAGWIGQGGQAQRIYSDVLLTSNSERARIGGIVGQMEGVNASVRKAYAKGMISAPKTINSEIGGIVGTIVGSHNSIIEDVISAINVPNGRKVYHSVTDEKLQVGKNYAVTGEASGQNNSKQEHLEASQVDGKLTEYGIQSRDTDARNHSFVSAKVDTDYSTHPHYQENRQLAYENMEKLLPFFTKDVIIQQANRLSLKDKLVTKKLLDVVAIDGHNNNRPVFDTQGQKQYINKVMFHFEDGSIDYDWLVKKQDLNSGAITEYYVVDREVTYTPENMVSATHLDQLVTRLLPEFESLTYSSKEVLDVLGLTDSSNDYAIKELLFLKESFGKVKANIRQHLRDLLVSNHAISLTSQVTEDYTFNYIKNNKVQLLLGLAYMDRWYNIQFGATNAKDWMTKKADFFGNSASSLNQLITLGGLGAGALKPNNNFALGSQLIAKPAVNGDLFAYLEAYRKRFAPEMSDSDWFKSATKANIIETNSTVEEVRAKQEDANNKKYSNRFYDKLKSDTWSFKEMALILLTMPERNIFVLTDMANTLIGSYDNQSGTKEEIEKAIAKTAKTWAGHADYLYRILPSGHKEKMFRQIITWDNRRLKGSWRPVDSLSSTAVPSMKDFYMPLGYSFPYGTGATAQSDLKDIFYSNADAIGNEGARIYTHELTHVADDDTFLLGHGRRSSMEFEVYARGLFETINWFDQDILGFNTIYDFSEYEKNSYGRRLTNLNPERFQSTQDLENYMRGYLDVIYTLDYLEAEAVLKLSGNRNYERARRNWFNKLETVDDNTSLISNHRINTNISTVEDLIAQGLVSRRSYDSIEVFPGNSYLTVNALNPIYGVTNNDGPSRNEFEFRKIAFELLAEKGYENGFVPYLSNQYQSELGQIDSAGRISDNQLISKITDGVYADSKAFRKDMFKRRKEKLDQLKPVTIYGKSDGEGYYYSASRQVESVQDLRQLMKEAVEYDAHRSLYASQKLYASQANGYNKTDSRVYSLKAAILNGYLRATDDFRQSIYKDTP
ncbi:ZmpA/ZmpB/ZmpC family metallo-endopeptidase [Streptococcus suis]|uniref:ZmpA/ZmpB/ZmpC family metallo-endopeptidase n=1 Tax=Streptococcus suis TaxID=1307 RepID=UPI001C95746A|nr:ZmpA/ZmpB/ZmpC family metallo-endopeptidase [Streptococcus suis]MBY4954690.1 G5 domain-containing protein [Streptococcus suis]MBY4969618.1 G5 domain-containing protein [Streptococcus suis]MBY5015816.1 G5 domain-containing protein [Streptococcus suis]